MLPAVNTQGYEYMYSGSNETTEALHAYMLQKDTGIADYKEFLYQRDKSSDTVRWQREIEAQKAQESPKRDGLWG